MKKKLLIENKSFLNFQLDFTLPTPRFWYSSPVIDGDWVYWAGGCDVYEDLNVFEKMNLVTGEVIELESLRLPYYGCKLFKT